MSAAANTAGETVRGRGLRRLLIILLALLAAHSVYRIFYPSVEWRQKTTVTIEVDGEIRSASSVVSLNVSYGPALLPEIKPIQSRQRGEAVVLEVRAGEYLFALLVPADAMVSRYYIGELFGEATAFTRAHFLRRLPAKLQTMRASQELPKKLYPLLVSFDDIADPKTVRRVDPDDLAASFGAGVALQSISLEITDEKVTKGRIEQVLGWWCDYRKRRARLNGSTSIAISDNELSNNLGTGAFRIGDCT